MTPKEGGSCTRSDAFDGQHRDISRRMLLKLPKNYGDKKRFQDTFRCLFDYKQTNIGKFVWIKMI